MQHSHMDVPGESRGCTLMAGDHHPGSLPGAPCGCARPPTHIFGGSRDGSRPCAV